VVSRSFLCGCNRGGERDGKGLFGVEACGLPRKRTGKAKAIKRGFGNIPKPQIGDSSKLFVCVVGVGCENIFKNNAGAKIIIAKIACL
jgi:hypothetical protein